jgi:hypothetical protein
MPWALRSVMSRLVARSRARVVSDAQQHWLIWAALLSRAG